jgi:hypothetical protein
MVQTQLFQLVSRHNFTTKTMRTYDNGSFYTVTCSEHDVRDFKSTWPCSGLPTRSISFQFDKRNGDLVDIRPDSQHFDGPALVALSQDAQAYGKKRLKLPA